MVKRISLQLVFGVIGTVFLFGITGVMLILMFVAQLVLKGL